MIRSFVFSLIAGMAALLAFAAPPRATAQYRGYPPVPQYPPSQSPYEPYQPAPNIQELAGTWFLSGNEEQPCQLIPSRRGNRALFINEKGDRAEGYLRGNRIIVPRWGNLQGSLRGDLIRWSNGSLWTR